MLHLLYQYLDFNILQYITLRASIAFLVSFIITIYLMPKFITWAKNKNANQPIFSLAPQNHKSKSKTPTMGGIIFLIGCLTSIIISAKLNNLYVLGAILTIIIFGFIGYKDDISKIVGKNNSAGLKPKTKLILQLTGACIISSIIFFESELGTGLFIPFYKYPLFDIGYFSIIFWILVIVASSNAVNLTDGLDGLATVPSIFALVTLGVFAYLSGHIILSEYLLLPNISNLGEISIVCTSMIGALVGFLWFNAHPAEVFMGDTGSLSLGALLGYIAIISKNEFLLVIIGSIFVVETLSVILQVGSYKMRQKRVFKMAPLHHHFELVGWAENKIIVRFWIISLISNLIAIATIKIR